MKTIEVDDEVYAHLQSKAIPFVETPNSTLRRLLLGDKTNSRESKVHSEQEDQTSKNGSTRKRRPNTDLQKLVQLDLISNGQTLYLYDYQGNKINGYEATVSGKKLQKDNKIFSMSELAKICLQEEGYDSDSVRGPAHWYNSDGVSVKELWDQYLKNYA